MSGKHSPGRVFVIPLLGGGYAFGVITFNDKSIGMFCDIFDVFAEHDTPPDDLATRPIALHDLYFGSEFTIKPGRGMGEPWRPTKLLLPGEFAPTTRWYLSGAPPRPYMRKDLLRELPPEPIVDEAEKHALLQLSSRFPPYRTAEAEVAVKHLDITPDELIAAWRARSN